MLVLTCKHYLIELERIAALYEQQRCGGTVALADDWVLVWCRRLWGPNPDIPNIDRFHIDLFPSNCLIRVIRTTNSLFPSLCPVRLVHKNRFTLNFHHKYGRQEDARRDDDGGGDDARRRPYLSTPISFSELHGTQHSFLYLQ